MKSNEYASKRVLDIAISLIALAVSFPVMSLGALLIYLQDRHNPFYCSWRVGRYGRLFRLVKLRTMWVGADSNKVDWTAADDPRLIPAARYLRFLKLDELPQFWNVLRGDMSIVGPRPNVERETAVYTAEERRMLEAKPGITDLASIVFADQPHIISSAAKPHSAYRELVRPWKSRLALLYCGKAGLLLDLEIILLTLFSAVCRQRVLLRVSALARRLGADDELCRVAQRVRPLAPALPPGAPEHTLRPESAR